MLPSPRSRGFLYCDNKNTKSCSGLSTVNSTSRDRFIVFSKKGGSKLTLFTYRFGAALCSTVCRKNTVISLNCRKLNLLSSSFTTISRRVMSSDSKSQYNVVFVLGGPGAGKGTQCEMIQETFGFQHLSAGELLRQERQFPGSQFGEEIEKHLKSGTIVPVEITCSLLRREMENSPKNNFLIDGFPRNRNNLDGWNKEMTGVAEVKRVLFFDCPEQVCIDRCLNRGKTSGRTDDNAESLKHRIQTYRESTMPIIDHYKAQDLVSAINGDRSTDEVFEDVRKVFIALNC